MVVLPQKPNSDIFDKTEEFNNLAFFKDIEKIYNNIIIINMLIDDIKKNNGKLQGNYDGGNFDQFKKMNLIDLTAKKNDFKKIILENIKNFLEKNNLNDLYEIISQEIEKNNYSTLEKILEFKNIDNLQNFSKNIETNNYIKKIKNKISNINFLPENIQIEDLLAFLIFLYFKNLS